MHMFGAESQLNGAGMRRSAGNRWSKRNGSGNVWISGRLSKSILSDAEKSRPGPFAQTIDPDRKQLNLVPVLQLLHSPPEKRRYRAMPSRNDDGPFCRSSSADPFGIT